VHSFTCVPEDESVRLADSYYNGQLICAAVQYKNIVGCQFHPEKSGPVGLAILEKFVLEGK
jgi:glutamine amidotransferase